MERIAFLLALAAVILAGLALYVVQPPVPVEAPAEESHKLVYQMGFLQRFAAKAEAAGAVSNWSLADFYAHELEETAAEIVEAGYTEDTHDVSELAGTWLLPALQRLGSAIDTEDASEFGLAFEGLIASCNACHEATDHAFLRMQVAPEHAFPNQVFDAD